jgi:hypothetical protein
MKIVKPFNKRRCAIVTEFLRLGFGGICSFYNVCKSIDATLNGFKLIEFYEDRLVDDVFVTKLESVIEILKYE